jgi:hypothetical protein
MTLTLQAQAQQTITDSVLKHTQALCEALTQNYIDYSIRRHQLILDTFTGKERAYHQFSITELKAGKCDYSHIIESGSKYHKIIQVIDNGPNRMGPSRSVHAFVDKKTGEVYKTCVSSSNVNGYSKMLTGLVVIFTDDDGLCNHNTSGICMGGICIVLPQV